MRSKMLGRALVVLAVTLLPASPSVWAQQEEAIDVAIALDTSESMKPLIDAARVKLWEIVNDLTLLDPPPDLRVALLTYGNQRNDRNKGWVRIETPLTKDLDLVSERLFALETGGGEEYVARVLQTAVEQLDWSDSYDAVKLVFVAGNESADQDKTVGMRDAALDASAKDVQFHAIFCGNASHPQAETWKVLAELAGGQFSAIDQREAALIETPYDRDLTDLGAKLNATFVPLGETGTKGQRAQAAQDANVGALGLAAAATRAQTKAGPLYSRSWDLVDAVESGRIDIHAMDESELPEDLREMSDAEREAYLFDLRARREEITQRIRELGAQRRQYVAEQMKKKGLDDSRTFDGVVRRAIRQQLREKGFQDRNP